MKYLTKCLNSYNKYLRKNIKLQIKDLPKIYSEIISPVVKEENITVSSITNSLNEEFTKSDKLAPSKYLARFMAIPETDQFLARESKIQKIKDITPFLTAIASAIIAILQLWPKK